MAHKMNTLLIMDVVVKLIDGSHRRMTMLTSYDPQIKPKNIGKDMLSFFLAEHANKPEYAGENVYEKVLGTPFTNYITSKVNELLISNGLQGKYSELTVLAVKELDRLKDMIISDTPFEVPAQSPEEAAPASENTEEAK